MPSWELSTLRALAVVDVWRGDPALTPRRLSAVGRGRWRQVSPNTTPAGRAANRRVEISLVSSPLTLGRFTLDELGVLFDEREVTTLLKHQ